jgi:hypothetical protein
MLLLLMAALAIAADITGKWRFDVETSAGSGTPVFDLKQDGEKLTGTYTGALGEAPVTGTVKGDDVEITFEVSPTGEKLVVKYTGKLDGENKIKGTVDLGGMAKGTFTGEKQK